MTKQTFHIDNPEQKHLPSKLKKRFSNNKLYINMGVYRFTS